MTASQEKRFVVTASTLEHGKPLLHSLSVFQTAHMISLRSWDMYMYLQRETVLRPSNIMSSSFFSAWDLEKNSFLKRISAKNSCFSSVSSNAAVVFKGFGCPVYQLLPQHVHFYDFGCKISLVAGGFL